MTDIVIYIKIIEKIFKVFAMKFQVMVKILFRLLKVRKVSAAVLAKENGVSERSIYRYVEELIVSGVPLDIIRGRNGGICLPDTYRLPENFFSKDELAAAGAG